MPASLRIEIFPANLQRCIDFYTAILRFTLVRHDAGDTYASFERDGIFIGAACMPASAYPDGNADVARYRSPPTGVEIVIEVDDLHAERELVQSRGGVLDADVTVQPWGLRDFRIKDPDGFYIRITDRGVGREEKDSAE